MKLGLKEYLYITSALFISSLLAMVMLVVVFSGAVNNLRETIGDFRLINSMLVQENDELRDEIARIEKQLIAGEPPSQTGSENKESSSASVNYSRGTIASNQFSPKTAYLTFDGGPSTSTGKILNILKEHNVKATFFVIGNTGSVERAMYRRIIEEGHAIGNLTYSHNFFQIYSSKDNYMDDFNQLQELVYEETGTIPKLYRFPGGADSAKRLLDSKFIKEIKGELAADGFATVDWNVDSQDASAYRVSKERVVNAVLTQIEGKEEAIILLHDSSVKTAGIQALPEIIEKLVEMGYSLEALSVDKIQTNL